MNTPQFHCDVDPEDYITAQKTDSDTVLIKTVLWSTNGVDGELHNECAVELDKMQLLGFIEQLSIIASQLPYVPNH